MVTQLLYKYEVDGIDITSYILINSQIIINRNNLDGNTANLYVADTALMVLPAVIEGKEIVVSRGVLSSTERYIFKGEIKKVGYAENQLVFECKDKLQQLKYNLFGTHTERTYAWPGEKIIMKVVDESLKQIEAGLKPVVQSM